jgi:hypothetical protein
MLTPITIVYLVILACVLALVVWNLFTEKKFTNQITAAMVTIPLILRLLLIK